MIQDLKIKYFDEEIDIYNEHNIINKKTNTIMLDKIPSERGIYVKYKNKEFVEVQNNPSQYEFVADRETSTLLFNPIMAGKEVEIDYSAIGKFCMSADKVYTNIDDNGDVIQTLDELLVENHKILESVKTVGDGATVITQLQANIDSVVGLTGSIAEGSTVNDKLIKTTNNAKATDITLNNSVANANSKLNDLNTWVDNHGNIVDLDNRVESVETSIPQINSQLDNIENNELVNISTIIPYRINGEVDDTKALQRAVDSGKCIFIKKQLTISNSIILNKNTFIIGGANSNYDIVNNSSNFAFVYYTEEKETQYDINLTIHFENLKYLGKQFLELNDSTKDFNKIAHLKGCLINNCILHGNGSYDNDVNKYTTIEPSIDELRSFGSCIKATKVFDMAIRDTELQFYGIALDFNGSDINLIDNCRLNANARHFNDKRIGTYGSQNKLKNCDILSFSRLNGIYLDNVRWNTIEDNYFECYSNNACFLLDNNCIGNSINNNRLDNTKLTSLPMMLFKPRYGLSFNYNRLNPSDSVSYIEISSINYDNAKQYLADMTNNQYALQEIIRFIPFVKNKETECNVFGWDNIAYTLGGSISLTYPFEQSGNDWYIKANSSNSVILRLKPKFKTGKYKLNINSIDKTGTFYLKVTPNAYNGSAIISEHVNKFGSISITNDANIFYIEYMPSENKLLSLELESVYS